LSNVKPVFSFLRFVGGCHGHFLACFFFFVDIFWYIWHQDLHSTLNKLAEEKVMGVMSGDAGGGVSISQPGTAVHTAADSTEVARP